MRASNKYFFSAPLILFLCGVVMSLSLGFWFNLFTFISASLACIICWGRGLEADAEEIKEKLKPIK